MTYLARAIGPLIWLCASVIGVAIGLPVHADLCQDAVPVTAGTVTASMTGATPVTIAGTCGNGRIGRWFVYQVTERSLVTVTACSTAFSLTFGTRPACDSTRAVSAFA